MADDLEITSIGVLYHGPLDKKYWSCSRGKDRHPYPVGYRAVRTHGGNTYVMEVLEGSRGPVFVVTSSDGYSSSGQTPDIAWEKFQRETGPRVKNRNGKRFSSNVDGVELFGFRNPFVQRLLRELVTNMYGVALRDLTSPSAEKEVSKLHDGKQDQDFQESNRLLVYSKKKPTPKKRSGKIEASAELVCSESENRSVRFKCAENDAKSDISHQLTSLSSQNPENGTLHPSHSYLVKDSSDGYAEVLLEQVPDVKRHLLIARETQQLELQQTNQFIEKHTVDDDRNKSMCREILGLSYISSHNHAENILLDGSSIPSVPSKSNIYDGGIPDPEHHSGAIIPDTCDTGKNDVAEFTRTSCDQNSVPAQLCLADGSILKPSIRDLHPEDASTSGSSDPISQRGGPDSAVQELTKSMMVFLLPRAVPLIKKTYEKRSKSRNKEVKSVACSTEGKLGGMLETYSLMQDPEVQFASKTHQVNSVHGHIKSECCSNRTLVNGAEFIIPDSFEEDKCSDVFSLKRPTECCRSPNAASDGTRGFIKSPLIDVKEKNQELCDPSLGTHGCDGAILRKRLDKNQYELSDSLAAYLEEEFNNEFANARKKVSYDASYSGVMSKVKIPILEPSDNGDHRNSADHNLEENIVVHHVIHDSPISNCRFKQFGQDPTTQNQNISSPVKRHDCKSIQRKTLDIGSKGPEQSLQRSSTDYLANFEVENCVQSSHGNIDKVGAEPQLQVGLDTEVIVGQEVVSRTVGKLLRSLHFSQSPCVPLSESLICRNYKDVNIFETSRALKVSKIVESTETRSSKIDVHQSVRNYVGDAKYSNADNLSVSSLEKNCLHAVNELHLPAKLSLEPFHECQKDLTGQRSNVREDCSNSDKNSLKEKDMDDNCKYVHAMSTLKFLPDGSQSYSTGSNGELRRRGSLELVGCYIHPDPVLSIFLISNIGHIQICALCGVIGSKRRHLFIYTVSLENEDLTAPSFVGYTELVFPLLPGPFHEIGQKSLLQLTPDGLLVTVNSIKTPLCRKRSIDCSCSFCQVNCCDGYAIQVGEVKLGFVLPLGKLTTADSLSCILVSEPNYLLAVKGSGELYLWLMNCKWSASIEEFLLPSCNHLAVPVELKKVPKTNTLVIGHDGIGGFGLWDISKRILLAKFSAPSHTVVQVLPVGLFTLHDEEFTENADYMNEHILAANGCVLESSGDYLSLKEDAALLLLILTSMETGEYYPADPNAHSLQWRLALLAQNTVVMGSVLDHRASTVEVLDGCGIVGTYEGLVYRWDLSTGKKIENLHHFECRSVSCAVADDKSGVVAVADDKSELLVFNYAKGKGMPNLT